MSAGVPARVVERLAARDAARREKDFALADSIRIELDLDGWVVHDSPEGSTASSRLDTVETFAQHGAVTRAAVSHQIDMTVCVAHHGWPEDVRRLASGLRDADARIEVVAVDLTGAAVPNDLTDTMSAPVPRVVRLAEDLGHAQAWNVAARLSRGSVLAFIDASIELDGPAIAALLAASREPGAGLCGPFGLRRAADGNFEAADDGNPDALDYVICMRREVFDAVGEFDPRYRFYRNLDIDYCYQARAAGIPVRRVECRGVTRLAHRLWDSTPEVERERLSKKNFNLYLDRWVR
jgi:glycosyltransferase involved in cell wall biosynthesis